MKDFLGNTVELGDIIFYSTTGRYAESRLCKIIKFTPKSIRVDVLKNNRPDRCPTNVLVSNSFVRVCSEKASKDFSYIVDYLSEGDLEHLTEEIDNVSQTLKAI